MLPHKSAVISKLSVTRDPLMRSPLLLCNSLSAFLFTPFSRFHFFYRSRSAVSLRLMDVFCCQGLFLLFVCVRASERFCLKSSCRENGLICSKKASSLEGTGVSRVPHPPWFFILRCVQLQRYVSKPHRQSSSVKTRPLFWNTTVQLKGWWDVGSNARAVG